MRFLLTLGINAHATNVLATSVPEYQIVGAAIARVGNDEVKYTYNGDPVGALFNGYSGPNVTSNPVDTHVTRTADGSVDEGLTGLRTDLVAQANEIRDSGAFGNSSLRANLATGEIGVASEASSDGISQFAVQHGGFGQALVSITDTLTFHIAGAGPTTETHINVDYTVHGSITHTPNIHIPEAGSNIITASLLLSGVQNILDDGRTAAGFAGGDNPPHGFTITSTSIPTTIGNGVWDLTSLGDFAFTGFFTVTGDTGIIRIQTALNAQASMGSTNFLSTGTLRFVNLPQNVRFSSASGVFLAPVPNPASWIMLASALTTLSILMRRTRETRT